MSMLNVEIYTPSQKIYDGQVYMVNVPGVSGSMGFLPGHVGLVTPLSKGIVKLMQSETPNDSTDKVFEVEGGYVQIIDDKVIVLTEKILN